MEGAYEPKTLQDAILYFGDPGNSVDLGSTHREDGHGGGAIMMPVYVSDRDAESVTAINFKMD